MKAINKSLPIFLFLISLIGYIQIAGAQKTPAAKEVMVKNIIDSQRYVFHAQSVLPASGRQRVLTSDYTVDVSRDTVASDLPFFGRAYSAPLNPTDGGIQFTSTHFDYQPTARKKGGWNINIKPKDVSEVQQLFLTIFENGTASLNVTSTNRQPVSFNGYVSGKKIKE